MPEPGPGPSPPLPAESLPAVLEALYAELRRGAAAVAATNAANSRLPSPALVCFF